MKSCIHQPEFSGYRLIFLPGFSKGAAQQIDLGPGQRLSHTCITNFRCVVHPTPSAFIISSLENDYLHFNKSYCGTTRGLQRKEDNGFSGGMLNLGHLPWPTKCTFHNIPCTESFSTTKEKEKREKMQWH